MTLNPTALEAAARAIAEKERIPVNDKHRAYAQAAVTAHLAALPSEHGELVERLTKSANEMREEEQNGWPITVDEAATALQSLTAQNAAQAARIAELEEGLKPFATEALTISDRTGVPEIAISDETFVGLRLGLCRKARALLEKST